MSPLYHFLLPHESNNQRARILHPAFLATLVLVVGLFQSGLSFFSARFTQILGYASSISPQEVVRLTNVERQRNHLAAVRLDPQLSQAAAVKAGDMFARNYWAHVSPSGTQPWFFISQAGYTYRYAGENLARDFADSTSVVQAWLASPTHRENLLSNRYQDIGVAVVNGQLAGRETTLVVQMFGTRLAASSAVGSPGITAQAAAPSSPASALSLTTASISPPRSSPALISPFDVTRTVSLTILSFLVLILTLDVVIINRRRLTRWTSKSLAHLMFIGIIFIAAVAIVRGQIL